MNNLNVLIILWLVLISDVTFSQDFAPIGAQWYYSEHHAFSGDIDYLKIESVKDTVIKGLACRKLVKNTVLNCTGRFDSEYVYMEDSIAYFYDADFDDFQILFDLNAKKDSSWLIKIMDYDENIDTLKISVDSVDFFEVNSVKLKRLHVTYTGFYSGDIYMQYYSKILGTIGDIDYVFNIYPSWAGACDANYSGGLRCYSDDRLGFYETGLVDSCDYTYEWVGVNNNKPVILNIYPTIASNQIWISNAPDYFFRVKITDLAGKTMYVDNLRGDSEIDISNLQQGYYIIQILDNDTLLGFSKIIKNCRVGKGESHP
jgi:hypothetical protein